MSHRIAEDWQRVYAHPVYLLKTFVDGERFRRTCYRAANWMEVGRTTGRGKNDSTNQSNRSLKDVFVYPLERRFRERLQA
ncbi:MAG TPA: Druantia anti-phage system protein DruA [Bryobacteraceae bacterium]|nr:Druantia anti-phage system protein DruA [Bryobacteraceae bacterium]